MPVFSGVTVKVNSNLTEGTPLTNEADRRVLGGEEKFKPSTEGTDPPGACWLP